MIHAQQGHPALTSLSIAETWRLARRAAGDRATSLAVSFADRAGALGEILSTVSADRSADEAPVPAGGELPRPLRELYVLNVPSPLILADLQSQPLEAQGDVFVVGDDELLRIDPAASTAADALIWEGQASGGERLPVSGAETKARFANNERTLLVAAGDAVAGIDLATGASQWTVRVDGKIAAVAAGEGVCAVLSLRGQVTCLDAATGAVRWTADPVESASVELARAQVGLVVRDGRLLVVDHRGTVRWLEIDGGQAASPPIRPQRRCAWHETADGQLLLLVDDRLTVYPAGRAGGPAWSRRVGGAAAWCGSAGKGRAVIAYSRDGAWRMEVLAGSDGAALHRVELPLVDDQSPVLVSAATWRDDLYIFTRPEPGAGPMRRSAVIYGQRLDLATGKLVWRMPVAADAETAAFMPVFSWEHLIATGADGRTQVFSLTDGLRTRAFGGWTVAIDGTTGRPAVVGRRLLVPTSEGVVVYGRPD